MEAWRRRFGGLAEEIWRSGEGDLEAWRRRSGGLVEASFSSLLGRVAFLM